ncbi:hypothetical protein [Streptomyces sp. NPDC086182]|uniref:hypothetical protein n=1 Tax=Streptomyces sp. NPDC086182 TaxID=3155058 RepID=UPI003417EBF9
MKTKSTGMIIFAILGFGFLAGSASASAAGNSPDGVISSAAPTSDETGWVSPADTGW